MAYDWTCPHCGTHTTIQSSNYQSATHDLIVEKATANEAVRMTNFVIKCPSRKCGKLVVDVTADYYPLTRYSENEAYIPSNSKAIGPVGPGAFRFEPRVGQPLSAYVPGVVKQDYEEACLIRTMSPKASATLCRRALQGMIRHFWGVSKDTLAKELDAIKDKCDPDLYAALMSLKGIGNIGAHPERDINLIVDVAAGEVDELLELLRILDVEWYIAKEERKKRLASVTEIGNKKAEEKKSSPKT